MLMSPSSSPRRRRTRAANRSTRLSRERAIGSNDQKKPRSREGFDPDPMPSRPPLGSPSTGGREVRPSRSGLSGLLARPGWRREDPPRHSGLAASEAENAHLEQIVADDIDKIAALGDPGRGSDVGGMAFSRWPAQIEILQPAELERRQLLARNPNGAHALQIPASTRPNPSGCVSRSACRPQGHRERLRHVLAHHRCIPDAALLLAPRSS